ncbi:MAG TPA: hypothetical protein VFI16_05415 [Anaeromyxobacteraceae bacterium]|nr:hypothetical protein [Anaeromyxobacteraceae bacterium]
MALAGGTKAPDFTLPDEGGAGARPFDFGGRTAVDREVGEVPAAF